MFHTSTQRKHWMFSSHEEVENLRRKVNSDYIAKFRETNNPANNEDIPCLTVDEEKLLVEYYQLVLAEVTTKFNPPMPNSSVATALAYMKRFYLKTSVMEYPPREMYLVFLYMACKVDEYNISAEKFVCILPADRREKALDFILSHELLLMQQLDFHMTIHNAYRPLEGFIIDMKTRLSLNPDLYRSKAEHFLMMSLRTDALFYYPPSQLALAALHYGCGNDDVEKYILALGNSDKNRQLTAQVKRIIDLVTLQQPDVAKEQVKVVEQKLKGCRNPDNYPDGKGKKKRNGKKLDDSDISEKEPDIEMDSD